MRNIWLGRLLSWVFCRTFCIKVFISMIIEWVVRKINKDDDDYGDKLYRGLW